MSKEGFALILLEDVVKVCRPKDQGELELTYSVTGSNEEWVQTGREFLDEKMESLGAKKVEQSGKDPKQFSFSGKTWKAPWNPKGPTPPWARNPSDN